MRNFLLNISSFSLFDSPSTLVPVLVLLVTVLIWRYWNNSSSSQNQSSLTVASDSTSEEHIRAKRLRKLQTTTTNNNMDQTNNNIDHNDQSKDQYTPETSSSSMEVDHSSTMNKTSSSPLPSSSSSSSSTSSTSSTSSIADPPRTSSIDTAWFQSAPNRSVFLSIKRNDTNNANGTSADAANHENSSAVAPMDTSSDVSSTTSSISTSVSNDQVSSSSSLSSSTSTSVSSPMNESSSTTSSTPASATNGRTNRPMSRLLAQFASPTTDTANSVPVTKSSNNGAASPVSNSSMSKLSSSPSTSSPLLRSSSTNSSSTTSSSNFSPATRSVSAKDPSNFSLGPSASSSSWSASAPNTTAVTDQIEWLDLTITNVCQFTLNSNAAQSLGVRALHLPQTAAETPEDAKHKRPLLSLNSLESALIERCQLPFSYTTNSLIFLIGCYSRTSELIQKIKQDASDKNASNKLTSLETMNETFVAFAGMCLQGALHEDNNITQSCRDAFYQLLTADSKLQKTLPDGFLTRLVKKFEDDSTLEEQFSPIIARLAEALVNTTARDLAITEFHPIKIETVMTPLRGLSLLATQAPLSKMVTSLSSFSPAHVANGKQIELLTFFGPSFSLSTINVPNTRKAVEYCRDFPRISSELEKLCKDAQISVMFLQKELFNAVNSIMRYNPESREVVLDWISKSLKLNQPRTKMQYNADTCASHGFMLNLNSVLCQLCIPFTSRIDMLSKIDPSYLLGGANRRVDYSSVERLSASLKDVQALQLGADASSKYNFITDVFFLTLHGLHSGIMVAISDLHDMHNSIGRLYHDLEEMGNDHGTDHPMYREANERLIGMVAVTELLTTALTNSDLCALVANFYEYVCAWFLYQLKLSEQGDKNAEKWLAIMPEHVVQDIVEFFVFLNKKSKSTVLTGSWYSLLSFVCVCMQRKGMVEVSRTAVGELAVLGSHGTLVKNPHLRAQLADVLSLFLPGREVDGSFKLRKEHVFATHPSLYQELVPSLLKLYADVEYTGRHAQFYEKFEPRSTINDVLEFIWEYAPHRKTFEILSTTDATDFPRFIHTIISDCIFLFDESFKNLAIMHEVEAKQKSHSSWLLLPNSERLDLQAKLRGAQNMLSWSTRFASSTFRLFRSLATSALTHSFISAQFAQSTAHMLDYFITQIGGPIFQEKYSIEDPGKYKFHANQLLRDLLTIFLCCTQHKDGLSFKNEVAADPRSFDPEIFRNIAKMARSSRILSSMESLTFEKVIEEMVILHKELNESHMLDTDDIPEEYLDAITSDLMKDPLLLPSGQHVDRSSIQRHLYSQPTNPFTQTPLKIEECKECPDLKAKIQQWIQEQRQSKKSSDDHSSSSS